MALVQPFIFRRPLHPRGNTSLLVSQFRVPAVSAPTVTWDPANKDATITLSGGNLVATAAAGGGFGNVLATSSKSSGKWYWEVAISGSVNNYGVGIAKAGASLTNYLGSGSADASGYYASGFTGLNGGNAGTKDAFTAGDIIRVSWDADAGIIYWQKNTTTEWGDPVAATGGLSVGTGTFFAAAGGGDGVGTANFTAASQTYGPPAGYSAYDSAAAPSNEISGTSSLVFAPSATATGLGTLAGSSALTLTGSGTATGLGTLAGSSSLVLTPSGTATGLAALIGTSALTFAPSATATGLGTLIGNSAVIFAPSATIAGFGTLAGASTLTLAGSGTTTGIGTLAGSSSLVLTGSAGLTGIGSLLASTALSFSLSGALNLTTNQIVGSTALGFSGSATVTGLGQIAASTSFSLTISGVMVAGAFGEVKVRILDEWQAKPIKFWDGTAWVVKPLKYWTGTAWQATSY